MLTGALIGGAIGAAIGSVVMWYLRPPQDPVGTTVDGFKRILLEHNQKHGDEVV